MLAFLLDNWMLVALAVVSGALLVHGIAEERVFGVPRLSPAQAVRLINQRDALVIDVRPADAFAKGRIGGSVNLPATSADVPDAVLRKAGQRPLLVVCDTGSTAARTARRLRSDGREVSVLAGGLAAWREAGLPLGR